MGVCLAQNNHISNVMKFGCLDKNCEGFTIGTPMAITVKKVECCYKMWQARVLPQNVKTS